MLPLQRLFGAIILRHARAAHRFVVEQVRLEAQSAQWARRYQAARDDAERALRAHGEFLARAGHDLQTRAGSGVPRGQLCGVNDQFPTAGPALSRFGHRGTGAARWRHSAAACHQAA